MIPDSRYVNVTLRFKDRVGRAWARRAVSYTQKTHAFPFGANVSALQTPHFWPCMSGLTHLWYPDQAAPNGPTPVPYPMPTEPLNIRTSCAHTPFYALKEVTAPWHAAADLDDLLTYMWDYVTFFGSHRVYDIVNEPIHHYNTFTRELFAAAKGLKRRLNEYDWHNPEVLEEIAQYSDVFDILGLQCHLYDVDWTNQFYDWIPVWLENASKLGKPIHITEMSVPSAGRNYTPELQAEIVCRLYDIFFSHPAVEYIAYWDVLDSWAWNPSSGLYTAPNEPKPAAQALQSLIKTTWNTSGSIQTDSRGMCNLRLLKGNYLFNNRTTRDISADGVYTLAI